MFWRKANKEEIHSVPVGIFPGRGNKFSNQGFSIVGNFPTSGNFAGKGFSEEMNFLDDRNFPDDENPPVERNFTGAGIFGQGEVVGGEISREKKDFRADFAGNMKPRLTGTPRVRQRG